MLTNGEPERGKLQKIRIEYTLRPALPEPRCRIVSNFGRHKKKIRIVVAQLVTELHGLDFCFVGNNTNLAHKVDHPSSIDECHQSAHLIPDRDAPASAISVSRFCSL